MVANNIEKGITNWDKDEDPVGIYEIAKMLNFKESTVSSWRQRHQMPKPDKLVNNGKTPLWKTNPNNVPKSGKSECYFINEEYNSSPPRFSLES